MRMSILKIFQNVPVRVRVACFLIIVILSTLSSIRAFAIGATNSAIAIEPENGTIHGTVSIQSDPLASNGQYIAFNATPTPTQVQQLSLSNVSIADTTNAKNYSLESNLQPGNQLYGDRTYTIKSLPASFNGSQWLKTANNSKTWNAGPTLISFTINKQAVISVAVDTRLQKLSWMDASWSNSGMKMTDNEKATITFALYQKTFPAGTVTLGANAGGTNSDMYTVIAQ